MLINQKNIAVLMIVFTTSVYATSKQFDTCVEKVNAYATKNSKWNQCIDDELQRQNINLKKQYIQLSKQCDKTHKKIITTIINEHNHNKNTDCVTEIPNDPVEAINRGVCILDKNDELLDFLKKYMKNSCK